MSKKNLVVLSAILALIPTQAFAATIQETTMTIEIIHLKIAFAFAAIIAIRFLFEDWMQNRQIKALKAEIANLKETAILNNEAHKETRRDAAEAWQEVETLRAQNNRLESRVTSLNKEVDDLVEEVLSNAAAFHKERTKLQGDVQWNADQAQSMATTANNNAKLANEYLAKLQDLNQI